MSADLKSNSIFDRLSFVLMDDSLVRLEHSSTKDRIRKFRYIEIEAITFSRAVPFVRILLCVVFLVLPGLGVLFVNETATTVIGLLLAPFGVALILWYMFAGSTTIHIYRAHKPTPEKVTGIFRPGRLRRFKENLTAGIQRAQSNAALGAATPPPASQPPAAFGDAGLTPDSSVPTPVTAPPPMGHA